MSNGECYDIVIYQILYFINVLAEIEINFCYNRVKSMMDYLLAPLAVIIGYLLGSFPTAVIVSRIRKGIDIRDVDIGNMGGGSVLRQVGTVEGAFVIVVDMAKGAAAIGIAQALGVAEIWVLAAGFTAVLGHIFPVYVGFKGGQGVATIMGIFFVLSPVVMALLFGVWGIILFSTLRSFKKNLFLLVCIISPLLPLFLWLFHYPLMIILYSVVYIIFLILKNMRRLREFKLLVKKKKTTGTEESTFENECAPIDEEDDIKVVDS
jgi:glycerol-3-phosphate acyltransferase PlsY